MIETLSDNMPPQEMKLSMPEFRHKVVDAETGKPIEGLFVYGFAALYRGSYMGGKRDGMVARTFELMTDANGEFILPAWERTVSFNGEPERQFPHISMWKPGYQYTQYSGGSLYSFGPGLPEAVRSYYGGSWKDKGPAVIDWRHTPTRLPPAKTLRERFDSYLGSGSQGSPLSVPCGFNDYPRLLVVQHYEWKALLKEIVPARSIGADGYVVGDFVHPGLHFSSGYVDRRSVIDNLKHWNCPEGPASDLLKRYGLSGEKLK